MEVLKIAKQEESRLIVNKEKLNVAAYARVSTESDDQINSFESQKMYYENKINSNINWKLVEVYSDYGISGTSVKKRESFTRMINDAINGKIDLILTKSISRFARNTVDALNFIRLLKENNIAVYFEEENINTLESSGEFLITVLSSVAQQESINISLNVRKGHEMLLKKGKVILGVRCFGYKFINKENRIEIVPNEAKVVKQIFKEFLKVKSLSKVKDYLEKKKIKTYKGREVWNKETIRRILTNEKYVGDLLQRKNVIHNPLGKIRINNGIEDKYLIKDFHEAIINRDDFKKVQEILKKIYDSKKSHKKPTHNILSYKIKCGYCGNPNNNLYIKRSGLTSICKLRKHNGRKYCPNSKNIHFQKIFEIVCKGLDNSKQDVMKSDNENLLYVKNLLKNKKFDNNELIKKAVKFVIIGGYDAYKRPLPYMVRIILLNKCLLDDYMLKKINKEEVLSIKTSIIYNGWISKKIITYGPKGPHHREIVIPKVKVTVEAENGNN